MNMIHHALILNLHQPPLNLEHLLDNQPWETKEILFALDRIPRSLWRNEDLGRVHLAMSGTLLETLASTEFQQRVYGTVDCGSLLWHLQNRHIIRILGTGYYHPVLPLIPTKDRPDQLDRWLNLATHLFARTDFNGFWPPELGFCMELIPLLQQRGYRFVIVDSEHVRPVGKMSWQELRYRPHIARYKGSEITVVVRDRELSDAQESGMEYGWFSNEVHERTRWCDFEPLVATATDGDNGGWFRNTTAQGNFWGAFYDPYMNELRHGRDNIKPTFIEDYLDKYPATTEVTVETGAWNTGWHHGRGFVQWTGSDMQKDAIKRVQITSDEFHRVAELCHKNAQAIEFGDILEQAYWRLLRAQTSCNIFWGEAWVQRCHDDLDGAWEHINQLKTRMPSTSAAKQKKPTTKPTPKAITEIA